MCPIAADPNFGAGAYYHPIGCCFFVNEYKYPTRRGGNTFTNPICFAWMGSITVLLCIATLGWQPCAICSGKCPYFGTCPLAEHLVTHDFVMKYPEKITSGPAKERFDTKKPHEYDERWNR